MTNTNTFAASIFDTMASAVNSDASRREDNTDAIKVIEAQKLNAYAGAVLALADVPLQKGNLPKAQADAFDAELLRVGLSKIDEKGKLTRGGAGKRFRENVPGIVRVMRLKKVSIPSQATVAYVLDMFDDMGLTSESKITEYCKAGRDKFLSKYWEAACLNVAKVTFGKDKRGAPIPTGMSFGKVFADRAASIGDDEAFEEMVGEMRSRFHSAKRMAEMSADETNANRATSDMMEEIFG